ncbi:hypothetical protein Vi05172_g1522 [Venturia inaequalis]|nr:hypothetical protein Vi05172_g1522 [Venturia inaequalis]
MIGLTFSVGCETLSCNNLQSTTSTTSLSIQANLYKKEPLPQPNQQTPHPSNMSAPNQGRQSPEPETQTDAQTGQQAQPNDQKANTEKSSDPKETLKGLESNPEHILAKSAEEKTSKQ